MDHLINQLKNVDELNEHLDVEKANLIKMNQHLNEKKVDFAHEYAKINQVFETLKRLNRSYKSRSSTWNTRKMNGLARRKRLSKRKTKLKKDYEIFKKTIFI